MVSDTTPSLSSTDAAVLSALFDPEASLRSPVRILPSTSLSLCNARPGDEQLRAKIRDAVKLVNDPSPCSESTKKALAMLDEVIAADQGLAEAWVNRAQARRLLLGWPGEMGVQLTKEQAAELKNVLSDLSQAIRLLSESVKGESPVTADVARSLASAYTHRGYILHTLSRHGMSEEGYKKIPGLETTSRDQLEEMASHDFAAGGRYGNEVAQKMSVINNPYAKLCGEIVREAMKREIEEAKSTP